MAAAPLPREIVKWLQSLDLSFVVKNPKRDLANGYLVAEIMSRFYPKDVNMMTFENGTRLEAKIDNWEQLYKVFRKKQLSPPIVKQDFDPVIHCAQHAALEFILKLYTVLTKKQLKFAMPEPDGTEVPAFMRDTASVRLKDHEIARVQDRVERTIRAIDTLGYYHEERRVQKLKEAPDLLREERRRKTKRPDRDLEMQSREINEDSVQVDEVRVKQKVDSTQLRQGQGKSTGATQNASTSDSHSTLMKKVSAPKSAVGALASMSPPALFVKPAMDIMRPLVQSIIQESEELTKIIDSKKDIVVSFMEQCQGNVREETSVKVFETLANRAQLLVESLTRSPPEFWKVWSTFYPALIDFGEQSQVFESAVFLFKRIGDLMREADPTLTQQLITEVGLPSLAKELCKSPDKREHLCDIIYCYTQEDTLNHLHVLRALKEKLADLPVYISCLACFISRDAQLSLLDDYLLDLYIYYAMVAIQSPQPKIRVAGISILSTIVTCSSQHNGVVALIPQFGDLANDDWWEVQAQLLLLSAQLLSKVTATGGQDVGDGESGTDHQDSPVGMASGRDTMMPGEDAMSPGGTDDVTAQLQEIISRLFVVDNSKHILQVGLSALVTLLDDYPDLHPIFVTILLSQPPALRQRLLRPLEETVTFQPGDTGIKENNCFVEGLVAGGQAEREGVKSGWRITAVHFATKQEEDVWLFEESVFCNSFSDKNFEDAQNGSTPYQVTFIDDGSGATTAGTKLVYVSGSSTRQYEEKCIASLWPHLDIAKTFVKVQSSQESPLEKWELPHMEVFLAALPPVFLDEDTEEWLELFDKVKWYIFLALVDPYMHGLSARIISQFWLCSVEELSRKSIETSHSILFQALRLMYRNKDGDNVVAKVDEEKLIKFLKDMSSRGGDVAFEIQEVLNDFKEHHADEYEASKLRTVFPKNK